MIWGSNNAGDILSRICADKRDHVAAAKRKRSLTDVEAMAKLAEMPRGFIRCLAETVAVGRNGLIAEIKKASPSKGLIRKDFDPFALARAYSDGGASCLSVLTDVPYFQGDDAYLAVARGAVELPVLRKDFMLDPYQIIESRGLGADCVLLIMAALDDVLAAELFDTAGAYGMDVLIEVHDNYEMQRAFRLEGGLLGINNRNLKTLEVNIAMTETLMPLVPEGRMVVSESGLNGPDDLARMARAGAECFLVGGSLMRQGDIVAATRALLGEAAE